ncbi:hypothetical protein OK18_19180 [Chryseobacterium gallinarum]|uniref:Uncharacterized protein n=1 Tax=Chryseobacterium gallinarum TaxID=1324352 RepID=A0A0G3M793_CHRGL|nr:hypothetical protein [Chryseobacterium gallinarum]AKK74455.1 hypothetical protein OK18_19180 [Chryseobacterium gallinarum]
MSKLKRKITLTIEFEIDNKLVRSNDKTELEYSLLDVLKEALNEDRLIIKETEINSTSELFFDVIIIS